MKIQQTNLYQKHKQNFGLNVNTVVKGRQHPMLAGTITRRNMFELYASLPQEFRIELATAMRQAGDANLYAVHTPDGKLLLSPFQNADRDYIDVSNVLASRRRIRSLGRSLLGIVKKHLIPKDANEPTFQISGDNGLFVREAGLAFKQWD